MIFRPELVKLIRSGRKTMTRRTVKAAQCRYHAGKSYAVQPGRGKLSVCRITVTDVRLEPLGELSLRDARREGFLTTAEFFDYWQALYGSVDRDQPVWVVAFLLGDHTDGDRYLAARSGGPGGDYVTNLHRALAQEDAPCLSATQQEHYSRLAHARDHERAGEPLREYRDVLAVQLEQANGRKETSRLQRKLATVNGKLAA